MKITEANLIDFYVLINRRKIIKMSTTNLQDGLYLKRKWLFY